VHVVALLKVLKCKLVIETLLRRVRQNVAWIGDVHACSNSFVIQLVGGKQNHVLRAKCCPPRYFMFSTKVNWNTSMMYSSVHWP